MNPQDYPQFVASRTKPSSAIRQDLTDFRVGLLHPAAKLCSEAGEFMDAVGKLCFYNKELDTQNVLEELGDIEFYLQVIRNELQISREDCILANMTKLSKRYPTGYSDKDAQARADKTPTNH